VSVAETAGEGAGGAATRFGPNGLGRAGLYLSWNLRASAGFANMGDGVDGTAGGDGDNGREGDEADGTGVDVDGDADGEAASSDLRFLRFLARLSSGPLLPVERGAEGCGEGDALGRGPS
jgi:hypothetical protein